MEQCIIKKLSATIGIVQNGTLIYEHQGQKLMATVGTPSWYVWLETATAFTFASEEGTFTARKVRAGNRRGGWYWRAYRRQHGRLSNCYLGVATNLTLPRLCETARHLAAYSDVTPIVKEAAEQRRELQTATSSDVRAPILILNTKFTSPCLPAQHVSRPHLLARLEQSVQRSLTLISAPAGSGKTTLLTEWAAATKLPVVWLSLEATDNDLTRFLSYLLAALARLNERIGISAQTDRSSYTHDHKHALIGLLNDIALLLQHDTVMILDNYHHITADAVHAALHFLLEHLSTHLHLIIGTRVDPPLPLARLRARNQLSELRMDELRFGASEVETFARLIELTLSSEALSLLQASTEGWITGIQLLTLALPGQTDAVAFLQASGGSHHFLLDYVSEEVLAQQSAEMQRFLLYTCILEQLTGPLCDAVTGESGGQARLVAALRANLFVSALDGTHTWYRYHPLFAEAMRTRLHTLKPDLVPELYRRAGYWYERQQRKEEACEYALRAGDLAHAALLLEQLIPHLLDQGKLLQISQWLSQLPASLIDASPALWLVSVLLRMLPTGILGSSERTIKLFIEQLEQQIQRHAQDKEAGWAELQLCLPLAQAMAALAQGDIAHSIALTRAIWSTLMRSESALSHVIALISKVVLGTAYSASGNLEAVEQLFFVGSPSGSTGVDRLCNLPIAPGLSDLYEAHGQLRNLGQFYDNLFQELAQRADPSPPLFSSLMQARYALLLYEWNRLTEAERAVQRSGEMMANVTAPMAPFVSLLNLWTQARIALARDDREEARQMLERVEFNQVTVQVAEQGKRLQGVIRARLALACGQLESALHWVEMCGLHFDDPPTFQPVICGYVDYITLARVLLAQGRDPRNGSRLAQATFLLKRLRNLTVEKGWQGRLREIEMLLALALQAQGKTKQALTLLGSVLAQAESEGYVRLFADEGQPMAQLLAQVAAYTTASSGYIQQLQAALAPIEQGSVDPAHPALCQPLPDPLSPREQEVLSLLAEGFSNQQIADHMVISLNTAKRHVKHLLAKLVVTNRTQALARAHELHLL